LQAAERAARERLAKRPDILPNLEQRGRQRAMIYKALVLTGLRKGELAVKGCPALTRRKKKSG
jgi:hypothetical protein